MLASLTMQRLREPDQLKVMKRREMYKTKINLVIDAMIGLAFIVEAVSGFVLWAVLPHGGYQGGRNLLYEGTFIFGRSAWLSLHDWFALVMVLGVLAHVVLHWRWITCMIRNLWREAFPARQHVQAVREECPAS
jgi:hypothetical protein